MNTFRSILGLTTFGFAISAAASAAPVKVDEIEVVADYASVGSESAAAYWPNLEDDLRGKIAQAVVGQAAEPGTADAFRIGVTIEEVSLDGQPTLGSSGEFNRLRGKVRISSEDAKNNQVFFVDVNTSASAPLNLPAGWTVGQPTEAAIYSSMLDAFVDTAIRRIARIDA